MVTAIVPVKTKSERLPEKNLRYFIDCPLYEHKLRQIQKAPFDQIVVSSESKEVLKVAEKYNCIPHLRDPKYSTPDIPMSEVYKYLASVVGTGDIAWVNVNNPLVEEAEYKQAIAAWKFIKNDNDCLLSVDSLQRYIYWQGKPLNWIPEAHPKSQDLGGLWALNFAINIRPKEDVVKTGCFVGANPHFLEIDKYKATKVDYAEDLEICRLLWKRN